jgi:hypothetical protein
MLKTREVGKFMGGPPKAKPAGRAKAAAANLAAELEKSRAAERAAVVDKFARLEAELAPWRAKLKQRDDIRVQILSWYPSLAGDASVIVPGNICSLEITQCDRLTTVTLEGKKKLVKLWGLPGFLGRALITLTRLDADIPKLQQGEYTETARIGPRHLRIVPAISEQVA